MPDVPNSQLKAEIASSPALSRGLNLTQALALNVANMVGIGPFITIPLFVASMNGPHALVAWIIAAVLVVCDGLVWSELGAALPGSGGTYHFLKEIYGPLHPFWGKLLPFLFIWQFLISGTMETASGYIGMMDYLQYIFPHLAETLQPIGGVSALAAGACVLVTLALCRRIEIVGWLVLVLCGGTLVCVLAVIFSAVPRFDASLLAFPTGELQWNNVGRLALGLGAAMHIAVYDYLGYYNVCHLGDEVRDPGRTIPRAVIGSVFIVATIYLVMNISIIGVIPWQEVIKSTHIGTDFMEHIYGRRVAQGFAWLIIWTAGASVFALTLGYSRIPFAAARAGDFFSVFAKLHPRGRYPIVSLLSVGGLTAVCCFFPLSTVIDVAVTARILIQFIGQIAALHILRKTRPDIPLPFRMKLYPLPSLIALLGWIYVLATSDLRVLGFAVGGTALGIPVFLAWQLWKSRAPQ